MSENLFEQNQDAPATDPNAVKLEDLVGEGKKYQTPEDLAKAYAHASTTITSREQELAELRDELKTSVSVEEALKNLQSQQTAADKPEEPQSPNDGEATEQRSEEVTGLTKEDVLKVLSEQKEHDAAKKNLETVQTLLNERTGSVEKSREFLTNKAAELGLSIAVLQETAQKSPVAFMKLVDLEPKTKDSGSLSFNTHTAPTERGPNTENPQTWEDFQEIRRIDRSRYFSPKIRNEMMKLQMSGKLKVPTSN